MSSGLAPPVHALASEPATYRIRREWIKDYRSRSFLIGILAIALAVLEYFAPSKGSIWPAVGLAAALAAYHYRVFVRDARYRFQISPYGVRSETSTDWVPWALVVALRERPTYNRIDLVGPRGRTGARLHFEIAEFDGVLAQVMRHMAWETKNVPSRFVRPWNSERIVFRVICATLVVGGGLAWLLRGHWGMLVLAAIGVLVGLAERSEISKTEVGPRTLSWKKGGRLHEMELSRISGVRLALRRSKFGSYLKVLVEGPDGPTDVRPKDADSFAVYRAVLAGLRLADSNAAAPGGRRVPPNRSPIGRELNR